MDKQKPDNLRRRALIVDDDSGVIKILTSIFNSQNYDVRSANLGQEGHRIFVQEQRDLPFDVVVADLRLSDMDGLALVRNIRAYEATLPARELKKSYVVLFTGYSAGKEQEALNAGCNLFLSKPMGLRTIMDLASTLPMRNIP